MKSFRILGFVITIAKKDPPPKKDFSSIRKSELRHWVRTGSGPSLENYKQYNKEVLGHE